MITDLDVIRVIQFSSIGEWLVVVTISTHVSVEIVAPRFACTVETRLNVEKDPRVGIRQRTTIQMSNQWLGLILLILDSDQMEAYGQTLLIHVEDGVSVDPLDTVFVPIGMVGQNTKQGIPVVKKYQQVGGKDRKCIKELGARNYRIRKNR